MYGPKPDYTLISYLEPSIDDSFFSNLKVSPNYYIVTKVSLKTDSVYIESPLQFSISFENRGKNQLENPRMEVIIMDYMHRIWSKWSRNETQNILQKQINMNYLFPPPDQKTIGTWYIYVMLYNNVDNQLISYESKLFVTNDIAPQNPLIQISSLLIIFIPVALLELYSRLRKRLKPTKKE